MKNINISVSVSKWSRPSFRCPLTNVEIHMVEVPTKDVEYSSCEDMVLPISNNYSNLNLSKLDRYAPNLLMGKFIKRSNVAFYEYEYRGESYRTKFHYDMRYTAKQKAVVNGFGRLVITDLPEYQNLDLVEYVDSNTIQIQIPIESNWIEMHYTEGVLEYNGNIIEVSKNSTQDGIYIQYGDSIYFNPSYRLTTYSELAIEREQRIRTECQDWIEMEFSISHNTNRLGSNCLVVDGEKVVFDVRTKTCTCANIVPIDVKYGGGGRYYSETWKMLVEPSLYEVLFNGESDGQTFQSYDNTWESEVVKPMNTFGGLFANAFANKKPIKKK